MKRWTLIGVFLLAGLAAVLVRTRAFSPDGPARAEPEPHAHAVGPAGPADGAGPGLEARGTEPSKGDPAGHASGEEVRTVTVHVVDVSGAAPLEGCAVSIYRLGAPGSGTAALALAQRLAASGVTDAEGLWRVILPSPAAPSGAGDSDGEARRHGPGDPLGSRRGDLARLESVRHRRSDRVCIWVSVRAGPSRRSTEAGADPHASRVRRKGRSR